MASIKVRAKESGGTTAVKCLISHPMEGGLRKDKKTGQVVPAHFITECTASVGGKTVFTALLSGGVSKNPYLSFKFKGAAKGDAIKIAWVDNTGGSDEAEAKIA